jgi:hypothetical protein
VLYFRGDEVIRREEDTAGRGRMDLVELFAQGRLIQRVRDSKGTGRWDTLYFYEDNQLTREERDTNGDGFFDLRIFYDKGVTVAQEADTNGDRRADVWVRFDNGEQAEQLEDQKYQGKVTARYVFKAGQVVHQEQLENADPPRLSEPFGNVEQALQSAVVYGKSEKVQTRASNVAPGVESGSEIK